MSKKIAVLVMALLLAAAVCQAQSWEKVADSAWQEQWYIDRESAASAPREMHTLYSAVVKALQADGSYILYTYFVRSDSRESYRSNGQQYDANGNFMKTVSTRKEIAADYRPGEWSGQIVDKIIVLGQAKAKSDKK